MGQRRRPGRKQQQPRQQQLRPGGWGSPPGEGGRGGRGKRCSRRRSQQPRLRPGGWGSPPGEGGRGGRGERCSRRCPGVGRGFPGMAPRPTPGRSERPGPPPRRGRSGAAPRATAPRQRGSGCMRRSSRNGSPGGGVEGGDVSSASGLGGPAPRGAPGPRPGALGFVGRVSSGPGPRDAGHSSGAQQSDSQEPGPRARLPGAPGSELSPRPGSRARTCAVG